MRVIVHANGDLTVPMRAEAEDGTIGDGMVRITANHPDYAAWREYLTRFPDAAEQEGSGV